MVRYLLAVKVLSLSNFTILGTTFSLFTSNLYFVYKISLYRHLHSNKILPFLMRDGYTDAKPAMSWVKPSQIPLGMGSK